MGDRFERHNPVGLIFLALIKALHARIVSDGEVRRLYKGPGQILVAVLGVAAAFALTLTSLVTIHTPALGGKLTDSCEAADITRL